MAWNLVWIEDDAGVADGLATLDGSAKVVQDPANAQETPAGRKIPIVMPGAKLVPGWLPTIPREDAPARRHRRSGDGHARRGRDPEGARRREARGRLASAGWPSGVAALDASKFILGSGLFVAGDHVGGARAGAIADPAGGTVIDGMCRAAVIQILNAPRGHGLIAP